MRALFFFNLISMLLVFSVARAQVGNLPPPPSGLPPSSGGGYNNVNSPPPPPPPLPQALPTAAPQSYAPGPGAGAVGSQISEESQGLYPILERNPTLPLGSLQRAWDAPYAASGQISPGVIRYVWQPNFVMAIRTREFMVTTVHLPSFEKISSIIVGDPVIFEVQQIQANVLGVRPSHAGADSNITVLGASGNVYSFYVRSEGFNTDQLSDITVYVEANPPFTVGGKGGPSGSHSFVNNVGAKAGGGNVVGSLSQFTGTPPEYIRQVAYDPENLSFDMTILAPTPEDAEIAPLRVFNDGVWTYFDFGEKTKSMRRPVVYLITDDVDSLVNTRTAGPIGNLLIAEAVGDFTLRNGNRVVCVYRKRSLKNVRNGSVLPSVAQPYLTNQDQLIVAPPDQISTEGQTKDNFLGSVSSWFE